MTILSIVGLLTRMSGQKVNKKDVPLKDETGMKRGHLKIRESGIKV